MACMPLVGFLLGKVQARDLIAAGLLIEVVSLYHLSGITTDVSYNHLAWARVFQAVGIAFLFVPVTSAAYVGIPPEKSNEASAMMNLMRNLGGSFGISLSQTALAEWTQRHQTHLVEHLTPYDRAYRDVVPKLAKQVGATPGSAEGSAALMQMVQRQATMLTYVEIFYVLAWAAGLMIPLVFLMNKTKPGRARPGTDPGGGR